MDSLETHKLTLKGYVDDVFLKAFPLEEEEYFSQVLTLHDDDESEEKEEEEEEKNDLTHQKIQEIRK